MGDLDFLIVLLLAYALAFASAVVFVFSLVRIYVLFQRGPTVRTYSRILMFASLAAAMLAIAWGLFPDEFLASAALIVAIPAAVFGVRAVFNRSSESPSAHELTSVGSSSTETTAGLAWSGPSNTLFSMEDVVRDLNRVRADPEELRIRLEFWREKSVTALQAAALSEWHDLLKTSRSIEELLSEKDLAQRRIARDASSLDADIEEQLLRRDAAKFHRSKLGESPEAD
jgi:hypothetical protein